MNDARKGGETLAGGTELAGSDGGEPGDWPLFYGRPELLSAAVHGAWRIRPAGMGFAARTNAVPIMVGEFAAAARFYPLVFVGTGHAPVAVLGLEQGNRFMRDDAWQPGTYVPAYVRRYPFVFAQVNDPPGFALAVDANAPMIVKEGSEGTALFEDGRPSEITRQALRFCDAFTREDATTREFVAALVREKLLVERTADVALPQGRRSALTGFSVVSVDAFLRLPEPAIVEWHRKGWLTLVHSHLDSLDRFADLLPG